MKPLIVDLPYPSLKNIKKDCAVARLIAPAYAGSHSEITAIMQYKYHHFYFENGGLKKTAEVLTQISLAEMKHLDILGEMLLKLGRDPFYGIDYPIGCNYYSASAVAYSKTPQKMILDDIAGEMLAIENYNKIVNEICNEEVSSVITRIRLDEELHVVALKNLFEEIRGRSYNG